MRRLCGDTKSAVEGSPEKLQIKFGIHQHTRSLDSGGTVNQLRGGVQREGKFWNGVPGRMGIYRKDGKRGSTRAEMEPGNQAWHH